MITKYQKDQIIALYQKGLEYKKIAREVGVCASTARSVCLVWFSSTKTKPMSFCLNCGKELFHSKGRKPKFCSDQCRYEWHSKMSNSKCRMNQCQFHSQIDYAQSVYVIRMLHDKGILTEDEFRGIEKILYQQFLPLIRDIRILSIEIAH